MNGIKYRKLTRSHQSSYTVRSSRYTLYNLPHHNMFFIGRLDVTTFRFCRTHARHNPHPIMDPPPLVLALRSLTPEPFTRFIRLATQVHNHLTE